MEFIDAVFYQIHSLSIFSSVYRGRLVANFKKKPYSTPPLKQLATPEKSGNSPSISLPPLQQKYRYILIQQLLRRNIRATGHCVQRHCTCG
ncbi:hypothetical protein ALO41_101672 [Pseudomonas amygdali pv. ulmi]|uniref:Uncharacterized protein n=1 Tax=Pseudomonas amygdali pv. ulmi TaxID=251720 RepID=A0A0Q0E2C1_PSEA0|nr:hypothetical protein ALO90_101792 [Pseudomonas amygdali pv. aesculi]KPZ05126.1 hypothetical protein ALO41_101672 [Pseudomonas amygdali pv. ulmi]